MDCVPGYTVRFFDRGGLSMDQPTALETLNWGRILDESSKSDMTFIISGDECCERLGRIRAMAHNYEIKRNNKMVWYGTVLNPEQSRKEYFLDGFDLIGWLKRRKIHQDHTWTNVDLSIQFEEVWNDAMAPDPVKGSVITIPTGTFETRMVKAAENKIAWTLVKEMLDSGLDITAFGQKILNGVVHTTKPMELKISDFEGDVRLVQNGSQYTNSVTVDASESIQAVWPDKPPAPNDYFPLVEAVVKDTEIQDVGSALNRAKAQYEYSRNIPWTLSNTENLVLQQNVDIDINDLIPGIRVIVDTEGLCSQFKIEFRLGELKVNVAGGVEKITISLEPVGPRTNLSSAIDPVQ